MAIVSRVATATPVTVVVAVGDGVGRGVGAMTDRETDGLTDDLIVGQTADPMAGHGVAPVAAARVILTLYATTPKPGSLRGDAAKSAMGVR